MSDEKPTASFEDVKSASTNPNILIVDVREPSELQEKGKIPGSINIPVGQFEDVLKNTSAEEFKASYDREKPSFDSEIIVSCQAGRRGARAQAAALELGYKKVRNYSGGFSDWEKQSSK